MIEAASSRSYHYPHDDTALLCTFLSFSLSPLTHYYSSLASLGFGWHSVLTWTNKLPIVGKNNEGVGLHEGSLYRPRADLCRHGPERNLEIRLGTLYDGARRAVSWPSIIAFCCHSTGVHLISGSLIGLPCAESTCSWRFNNPLMGRAGFLGLGRHLLRHSFLHIPDYSVGFEHPQRQSPLQHYLWMTIMALAVAAHIELFFETFSTPCFNPVWGFFGGRISSLNRGGDGREIGS